MFYSQCSEYQLLYLRARYPSEDRVERWASEISKLNGEDIASGNHTSGSEFWFPSKHKSLFGWHTRSDESHWRATAWRRTLRANGPAQSPELARGAHRRRSAPRDHPSAQAYLQASLSQRCLGRPTLFQVGLTFAEDVVGQPADR